MRLDSPFALSAAGTIAIHLILVVVGDAMQVYNPPRPPRPAPHIEIVDIEVPPVLQPPPPPEIKEPDPPPLELRPEPRRVEARTTTREVRTAEPPTEEPAPVEPTTDTPSGGEQVVTLDGAGSGPGGVPVSIGRRTSERVGRGGAGGGTGAGTGSGAGADPPAPVSVATIKKRAMPKGDQSYFDAGKDYPQEARQMGIEGVIRVRLVVDQSGRVATALLLNKLGHGLDELALSRAKLIEFEPARDTEERAVSSVVVWTFTMTLPK